MQVPSGSPHLLNKRFSILRFLVRSTVDQHPTVELDSLGTDYSTVPIPSHSTRTYVILLLDFSTKDLLTTSAVGTTTALTHLVYKIFCCLQQLWRLWMTFYLYLIRQICSWSATLSAARLLHSCLFTVSSSQSDAAHSGAHQPYSTFHVTLTHVGLQTLLQDLTLSSS